MFFQREIVENCQKLLRLPIVPDKFSKPLINITTINERMECKAQSSGRDLLVAQNYPAFSYFFYLSFAHSLPVIYGPIVYTW